MLKTQPIASAQKVLRVLKALRGHSLSGVTNQQLAQQLDEPPSAVTRALQTLVAEGFAEQQLDQSYTIGVAAVQIAKAHDEEVSRSQARIDELKQRVSVTRY